jgi:hypothetical protein
VNSSGKESFGKGSGLEVGLATNVPNNDLNQIVPGQRAEAGAQPAARSDGKTPPSLTDSGSVDTSLATITQASPLLYVDALLGHARARFDETQCITDGFMSEGQGRVAKAQLVDTAANAATPSLDAPLAAVNSDFFGSARGAADSKSYSYLVRNPDGTYGLATETHMTFAPIGLLQTSATAPPPVFVEILGEWIFKAVATGKPGGASVTYEVAGLSSGPDPAVVRIYLGATSASAMPTIEIKRSELFTPTGINVPIPGGAGPQLLNLTLGEDIRAIASPKVLPDPASQPTKAADGTLASGAADVIRIDLLNANSALPDGPRVADVRVGHLEAKAQVPKDGIACPAPPATTTTTGGSTTTTTSGSTTTTTSGSTTTTTAPSGSTTSTTAAPGSSTTTRATTTTTSGGGVGSNNATTTSSTIPTAVQGVNISRSTTPEAQPVTAQPRFTG